MKKFKKLSLCVAFALVIACFIPMLTGCFSFGNKYKSFEIEYTSNLVLLVGEDFRDPLLKGYGVKKDDSKDDVTDEMDIDTSEYNKEVPGTYKIYCEFNDAKLDYEVTVVEEITNDLLVNARLAEVVENTFKRNSNGVFS